MKKTLFLGPWELRLLAVKKNSCLFRYLYYLRILCIKIKLFAISLTSYNKHICSFIIIPTFFDNLYKQVQILNVYLLSYQCNPPKFICFPQFPIPYARHNKPISRFKNVFWKFLKKAHTRRAKTCDDFIRTFCCTFASLFVHTSIWLFWF